MVNPSSAGKAPSQLNKAMDTTALNNLGPLDVPAAAAFLGIAVVTLYRLVEKRAIPFHKYCSRLRFKQDDLNAFIEQSRVESIGQNAV